MNSLQIKLLGALYALTISVGTQAQNVSAVQTPLGEKIYKQTCVTCHASGLANAPKFGDKKAWKPLIAEGQHVLTAHAWVGVRAMPAKGGQPDLSLEDFSKAVVYMARAAGANWQDPDKQMLEKIRKEEQIRLKRLKDKN